MNKHILRHIIFSIAIAICGIYIGIVLAVIFPNTEYEVKPVIFVIAVLSIFAWSDLQYHNFREYYKNKLRNEIYAEMHQNLEMPNTYEDW